MSELGSVRRAVSFVPIRRGTVVVALLIAMVIVGLVVTAMARAMRDNSPPEATLPTGLGGLPGCPATRKLMSSRPHRVGCGAAWQPQRAGQHRRRSQPCPSCAIA